QCPLFPGQLDDFDASADSDGGQMRRCAKNLGRLDGRMLAQFLNIEAPPEAVDFFREKCQSQGLQFESVAVAGAYLNAAKVPGFRTHDSWTPLWACSPVECSTQFGSAVLPRLLEWLRAPGSPAVSMPPAGPCVGDPSSPETWDSASCLRHLELADSGQCRAMQCHWQIMSQETILMQLFGGQVGGVSEWHPDAKDPNLQDPNAAQALAAYDDCRLERHGKYSAVSFCARHTVNQKYEIFVLGMCAPTNCSAPTMFFWTQRFHSILLDGLFEMEEQWAQFKVDELGHRRELDLQWVIAGVARSGSSSFAAWLGGHPQLEVLRDKSNHCLEGDVGYLFIKSRLHFLLSRSDMMDFITPRAAPSRGLPRTLRGVKVPMISGQRYRRQLLEMPKLKVLFIVKDWIEMLRSRVLLCNDEINGTASGLLATLPLFNGSSAGCNAVMTMEEMSVPLIVHDLERMGFKPERVKVMHVDALQGDAATGSLHLARVARWLGASQAPPAEAKFPAINKWQSFPRDEAFWQDLCTLPQPQMRQLEELRRLQTAGLAALLRRTGEPVPACLRSPRPLRADACERARLSHLAATAKDWKFVSQGPAAMAMAKDK
ncbi:unnamed protein product, partial [Polarella glacialis]